MKSSRRPSMHTQVCLPASAFRRIFYFLHLLSTKLAEYLKKAGAGKGFDRLLWGMKLCLKDGESDPLFKDPMFNLSRTWVISTSHLAHEYVPRGSCWTVGTIYSILHYVTFYTGSLTDGGSVKFAIMVLE